MNTLGLGRQVNTFWLGLPYAGDIVIEEPEPATGGTSKKINRPYFWYKEKGLERERMARIKREDDEILEFIKVILTKGLL